MMEKIIVEKQECDCGKKFCTLNAYAKHLEKCQGLGTFDIILGLSRKERNMV